MFSIYPNWKPFITERMTISAVTPKAIPSAERRLVSADLPR
jgi:hypothetical protein